MEVLYRIRVLKPLTLLPKFPKEFMDVDFNVSLH